MGEGRGKARRSKPRPQGQCPSNAQALRRRVFCFDAPARGGRFCSDRRLQATMVMNALRLRGRNSRWGLRCLARRVKPPRVLQLLRARGEVAGYAFAVPAATVLAS